MVQNLEIGSLSILPIDVLNVIFSHFIERKDCQQVRLVCRAFSKLGILINLRKDLVFVYKPTAEIPVNLNLYGIVQIAVEHLNDLSALKIIENTHDLQRLVISINHSWEIENYEKWKESTSKLHEVIMSTNSIQSDSSITKNIFCKAKAINLCLFYSLEYSPLVKFFEHYSAKVVSFDLYLCTFDEAIVQGNFKEFRDFFKVFNKLKNLKSLSVIYNDFHSNVKEQDKRNEIIGMVLAELESKDSEINLTDIKFNIYFSSSLFTKLANFSKAKTVSHLSVEFYELTENTASDQDINLSFQSLFINFCNITKLTFKESTLSYLKGLAIALSQNNHIKELILDIMLYKDYKMYLVDLITTAKLEKLVFKCYDEKINEEIITLIANALAKNTTIKYLGFQGGVDSNAPSILAKSCMNREIVISFHNNLSLTQVFKTAKLQYEQKFKDEIKKPKLEPVGFGRW